VYESYPCIFQSCLHRLCGIREQQSINESGRRQVELGSYKPTPRVLVISLNSSPLLPEDRNCCSQPYNILGKFKGSSCGQGTARPSFLIDAVHFNSSMSLEISLGNLLLGGGVIVALAMAQTAWRYHQNRRASGYTPGLKAVVSVLRPSMFVMPTGKLPFAKDWHFNFGPDWWQRNRHHSKSSHSPAGIFI